MRRATLTRTAGQAEFDEVGRASACGGLQAASLPRGVGPAEAGCRLKPAPLVLALGNTLLRDDGVGVEILHALEREAAGWGDEVDFVDGGTQGLALLGVLSGRRAAVILDAIALGAAPGTVHVLSADDAARLRSRRSTTAHEGNAGELLAA